MSKTTAWVLVVLVIIGGAYYLLRNHDITERESTDIPNKVQTQNQTETKDNPLGKKMAFSQFAKQGGSYKCEVKQYLSDMDNTGTVYVNEGNISGKYTTIAEGKKVDTSFVLRDGYSYTWSSLMPNMGFKVKIATTTDGSNANTSGTYSWNADQIGDYMCVPWNADTAVFSLPAGVTFQDMSGK